MKRACRLCSASYDHHAWITPQGYFGRILSASRTVLKTHRAYYIMYTGEKQDLIFYNTVKIMKKTKQNGLAAVSSFDEFLSFKKRSRMVWKRFLLLMNFFLSKAKQNGLDAVSSFDETLSF